VSPVRYELGFYIPEDDVPHGHRHENLKPYIVFLFTRQQLSLTFDVHVIFYKLLHVIAASAVTPRTLHLVAPQLLDFALRFYVRKLFV
jgi:hypothetical protein